MTRKERTDINRKIRQVIDLEAAALRHVRNAINDSYAQAVQALSQCKGKVILTGVGKSGLIAQKIAATFSSTGTPAVYLDPNEAMHGGLGFIQRNDLLLAIGKSGESEEITAWLPNLRSIGAKLIAITSNPRSTLAKNAHIIIAIPPIDEACPLNLAPTTSTTVALAIGDALAIALMSLKNFKAEHFAHNHPGGRLGKRLNLRVSDIMRSGEDNPTILITQDVKHMLVEITRLHAGAISVTDSLGKLLGLVTDYDIRQALENGKDILSLTIRQIMNPKPTTVFSDEPAAKAILIMEDRKIPFNVLPIIDRRHRAVGMIQVHDLRARGL